MSTRREPSNGRDAQSFAADFARDARDRRVFFVAELLRAGWTGREVNAGLKVIDAGGGVELAMVAMRAARETRRS